MKLVLEFQNRLKGAMSVRIPEIFIRLLSQKFERVALIVDPPLAFVHQISIKALTDDTSDSIIYN